MICDCGQIMTLVNQEGTTRYFICKHCGNKIIDIV